jgi:hypothetical protein
MVRLAIRVERLITDHGKERAIEIIETFLSKFLMMTRNHFEYSKLLKKAVRLIKGGKFDRLPELDNQLKELEDYDLWN